MLENERVFESSDSCAAQQDLESLDDDNWI